MATVEELQKIAQDALNEIRGIRKRELILLQGGPKHNYVVGIDAGVSSTDYSESAWMIYERTNEVTPEGQAIFRYVNPS